MKSTQESILKYEYFLPLVSVGIPLPFSFYILQWVINTQ